MPGDLRLFVVDDDDGLRRVIAELVGATEGCVLWGSAPTGEAALDRIARCDGSDRPDVVLLDVELPGIDGLGVADRLLSEETPITIVLMSTHSLDDLPAEAVSKVARFVPKIELSPAVLASFRSLDVSRRLTP